MLKLRASTILAFLLVICSAATVYAITISVDGEAWDWEPAARVATDPIDMSNPGMDIADVYFTNDSSKLFWRVDTVSETIWGNPYVSGLLVCMDVDDDQSTGTGCTLCSINSDYAFLINNDSLIDVIGPDCSTDAALLNNSEAVSNGNVTELGINMSELGITGPCPPDCAIPSEILYINSYYMDVVTGINGAIPGPTSITLKDFSLRQSIGGIVPAVILAFLLALNGLVIYTNRTSKKIAQVN